MTYLTQPNTPSAAEAPASYAAYRAVISALIQLIQTLVREEDYHNAIAMTKVLQTVLEADIDNPQV